MASPRKNQVLLYDFKIQEIIDNLSKFKYDIIESSNKGIGEFKPCDPCECFYGYAETEALALEHFAFCYDAVMQAEKVAHASKEDDFYMVGFSDDKYDYQNYIILQKAFVFDAQDIELGMDGEYCEVNSQSNSAYKCCKKAFLSSDRFFMELDAEAGEINGVDIALTKVKISKKLVQYLKEILGDKLEVHVKNL